MKTFYVASYGKNNDKGIYIMRLNEETLVLIDLGETGGGIHVDGIEVADAHADYQYHPRRHQGSCPGVR